jgi:hypothetical protein
MSRSVYQICSPPSPQTCSTYRGCPYRAQGEYAGYRLGNEPRDTETTVFWEKKRASNIVKTQGDKLIAVEGCEQRKPATGGRLAV